MGVARTMRLLFLVTSATLVLVTLGSLRLLQTIGPDAERLADRVAELEAADEALGLLAAPFADDMGARWDDALARLEGGAETDAERAAVGTARRHGAAALEGDPLARVETAAAIRELVSTRRTSATDEARSTSRSARSGAWGVMLTGLAGYVATSIVSRRMRRRLVEPILELDRVLTAAERGEPGRRCRPLDAPQEVRALVRRVNELLDRTDAATREAGGAGGAG